MNLPAPYEDLAAKLEGRGFEARASAISDSFGDRSVTFTRLPVEVRLASDRGEWALDMRRVDWGPHDWFEPEVWRAYLTGQDVPAGLISRHEQVDLLEQDLERVSLLLGRDDFALLGRLRALQEAWVLKDLSSNPLAEPDDSSEGT
jgi:hypothetical protein